MSSNRMNIPSSMKDALGKPQKATDSTIVMKGKIDKTKVDNPAVSSSKVENPAALSLASSSSKVKKGAPHRQAIAVAASIDIDSNKEVPTGDDYEASKISRNKKSAKQEELESVLNLSKWGAQIGASDDDEGFDDW